MGDPVSHAELVVTTLLQDSGDIHKANLLTEFKFLSNNFDGLKFFYDHLNAAEEVEKVKTIGASTANPKHWSLLDEILWPGVCSKWVMHMSIMKFVL